MWNCSSVLFRIRFLFFSESNSICPTHWVAARACELRLIGSNIPGYFVHGFGTHGFQDRTRFTGFGTHAFHGGSLRLPNPTNKTKLSSFFKATVVPTLTFWLFFSLVLLGQQKRFVHFATMRFLFLKCRIQMIRQEKTSSSWFIMHCHVLREFLL